MSTGQRKAAWDADPLCAGSRATQHTHQNVEHASKISSCRLRRGVREWFELLKEQPEIQSRLDRLLGKEEEIRALQQLQQLQLQQLETHSRHRHFQWNLRRYRRAERP